MESEASSTVRRISVEEVSSRPRPLRENLFPNATVLNPPAETPPGPKLPPSPSTSSTLDVIVTAFGALGYALSARALLLLALVGAFVIGLKAMDVQTPLAMVGLAIYAIFTVVPVAYLEIVRRRA
jgi:hypothetical protein